MPIYDLHLYSQEINKNQDGVRVERGHWTGRAIAFSEVLEGELFYYALRRGRAAGRPFICQT